MKKCIVCGANCESNHIVKKEEMFGIGNGAELYYNLWHFDLEFCENCNYVSKDISECKNLRINELRVDFLESILIEMQMARPNSIEEYLRAGAYYLSISDNLTSALCYLQAGDLVYKELFYWQEYLLDDGNELLKIKSNGIRKEIKDYAEKIFDKGITLLRDSLSELEDLSYTLLYVGFLLTLDKDIAKAKELILKYDGLKLSAEDRLILDYIKSNFNYLLK